MESKTMNYKMIPGSREKDTEGTFRDTVPNNYMSAVNDGHEGAPFNHKVDGKEHKSEVDGHAHGGVINAVKNFARENLNPEIKYGSSSQQGGLSQRPPSNRFRPFGPKDSEIKKS